MTKDELELVKKALWIINPCQLKHDAIWLINREIKLKQFNPNSNESENEACSKEINVVRNSDSDS